MMKKRKEEAIKIERDWADLLPELFRLILKKLPNVSDFVRFRAVCKYWRLSSSVDDLPPQFPWILRESDGPDLKFYSMAFNKVYTIRAPCSSGKRPFKPAGGYMLIGQLGNYDSLSLLNPLNHIELPLPVIHDCNPYVVSKSNPPSFQIHDYMHASKTKMSVRCKPGDDKWDIIGHGHEFKYDCYYLKGFLFRVCHDRKNQNGVTQIWDISSRKELYIIPPPVYEDMTLGPYLVESCGDILAIGYKRYTNWTNYKFFIHLLEFGNGNGNPCWVKLSSIGDRILFFNFPLGTGRGFGLKASDFAGFKGNCIYFVYNGIPYIDHVQLINMYDVENGETVFIKTPFNPDLVLVKQYLATLLGLCLL